MRYPEFLVFSTTCVNRGSKLSTYATNFVLLDPADHLAARVARDGDTEELYFEETDSSFAIGWKGNYEIDGDAFIFIDRDTARITTIFGYPTRRLAQLG